MTSRLTLAAAVCSIFWAHLVHGAEYYGGSVVSIEDGDTFTLRDPQRSGDFAIRLCGVDAPERGHAGSREAHEALRNLIFGKTVRCLQTRVQVGARTPCDGLSAPSSCGRIVAQCFLIGMDIAAHMVRAGHACAWPKFSGRHYLLDPSTCVRAD